MSTQFLKLSDQSINTNYIEHVKSCNGFSFFEKLENAHYKIILTTKKTIYVYKYNTKNITICSSVWSNNPDYDLVTAFINAK